MVLPRTFVGFSATDSHYFESMLAWKEDEHIDFHFESLQLHKKTKIEDEATIKSICRDQINPAGKYVMLIGTDTKDEHTYVHWEAEVAIEKGCTIVGVNLDQARKMKLETCPKVIRDIGAVFVPFSPKVVAHAIKNYEMPVDNDNYFYNYQIYKQLGYRT